MSELMNKSSELSIPSLISEFQIRAFRSPFATFLKLHSGILKLEKKKFAYKGNRIEINFNASITINKKAMIIR